MSCPLVTLGEGVTLERIAHEMVSKDVGSIIIVDKNEDAVGIVTEKDLVRLMDANKLEKTSDWYAGQPYVCENSKLVIVQSTAKIGEAVSLMDRESIRHLPIVEDEELVGIVTTRDILNHAANLHKKGGKKLRRLSSSA